LKHLELGYFAVFHAKQHKTFCRLFSLPFWHLRYSHWWHASASHSSACWRPIDFLFADHAWRHSKTCSALCLSW